MRTYNFKTLATSISLGMMLGLNISCSKGSSSAESIKGEIITTAQTETVVKSVYDTNAYPLNKLVCDPFDPDPVPSAKHGIKSSLWFRGFNQPIYQSVMSYINNYTHSDQTLFFNSVNVPTRMFYDGFPLESGDVVRDDLGTQLIEYFAMKFESQIILGPDDSEGLYELAMLSDDGTILKIKDPDNVITTANSNGWETHINNDGDTPTRMKCSSRLVNMTRDKKIQMELLYYQGPRYHISNMLIWRKATQAGKDSLCNQSGNELFFDPKHNSAPLKWLDLAARGWRVLSTQNYLLPETGNSTSEGGDVDYNPCYTGTVPVISNFQVVEQLSNEVSFSWRTDIKAVSMMMVTNLDTGEKTVTQSDNVLRTTHQILISGLKNNTNYRFQVVAISEDLGRAISPAIDLKTF
tara:strand:+ start:25278 stop:26501 length:1224 start_codon:yes stop_codon:yes gene_type:complete